MSKTEKDISKSELKERSLEILKSLSQEDRIIMAALLYTATHATEKEEEALVFDVMRENELSIAPEHWRTF